MRVLAVNDVSCIGKCSLSVTLPIVSACGITCDVLPTALLSTHTGGFTGYTFRDLTEDMRGVLAHWKTLGVKFDIVYSGYLGSLEQIRLVEQIKTEFLADGGILIVDPVMGDSGKLYDRFDDEFVSTMRSLCAQADYILPNFTEACFLSGTAYEDGLQNPESVLEKLQSIHPCPVITGIHTGEKIGVYYFDDGKPTTYFLESSQGFFCGAGDVFASAFVGLIANGKPLADAVKIATDFTTGAIRRSAVEVTDKRYGINFEKELKRLINAL